MSEPTLQKKNMKVSTVVFMIFCICAAGAYGLEAMIPAAGPGLTIAMIIVIPLIWSLPLALVCAELGAERPIAGGAYRWVQESMGEFWGFQCGWWKILTAIVDPTIYIILAGGYIGYIFQIPSIWIYVFQIIAILVFVFINLRGLKEVGIVSTILSMTVLILFALIAIVGFLNWKTSPFEPFTIPGQPIIFGIGSAICIGLWMFSGYEQISALTGEVEDPKVIPKATLLALPLVVLCYLLPTVGGLASVGQWENWSPEMGGVGYGTVLIENLGPAFGIIFGIVAVIAQLSMFNTSLTNGSRVFYAMADDNMFPKAFAKISKKGNVPAVGIVTIGIIDILLCSLDFGVVVVIDVMLILSFHILLFITAIRMRKSIPDEERPIKIPGGDGFFTFICIVPIAVAVLSYLINGTDYFLFGSIALATGPIFYIICKRAFGGLKDKFPMDPRTKLEKGALKQFGFAMLIFGLFAFVGRVFLQWYEGDWGPGYYMDTYGFDCFQTFLNGIVIFGVVAIILAVIGFIASKVLEEK